MAVWGRRGLAGPRRVSAGAAEPRLAIWGTGGPLIRLTSSGAEAIFASSRYATLGWSHILKTLVRDLAREPVPFCDLRVAEGVRRLS